METNTGADRFWSGIGAGRPGRAGLLAADRVPQPRRLRVLRHDLTQHRLFEAAALNQELRAALKPLKGCRELIVMGREQLPGHLILAGQDQPKRRPPGLGQDTPRQPIPGCTASPPACARTGPSPPD